MDHSAPIDQLPKDVCWEIVLHMHQDELGRMAQASKQWETCMRQYVEKRYPEVAEMSIGGEKWKKFGAQDVGIVPRIPLSFYPDVARGEFILTWVPEKIDGKSMKDPATIDEFYKKNTKRVNSIYRWQWTDMIAEDTIKPAPGGRWVLLSRDVLPGSRGKPFESQQGVTGQKQMVEAAGYSVAHVMDVIVSLLLYQMHTGVYLYPDDSSGQQWTYTRVQENSKARFKIIVGGFSSAGLSVDDYYSSDDDDIGVARARKSIGLW